MMLHRIAEYMTQARTEYDAYAYNRGTAPFTHFISINCVCLHVRGQQ